MRYFSLLFSGRRVFSLLTIIFTVFAALHATAAGPTIYLQDAWEIGATFSGATAMARSLQTGQTRPLAMAEGDLDEDGAMELLVGYATPTGGALGVYKGNLDAFAPQGNAALSDIAANRFPTPLLPNAQLVSLPLVPDFVAVGQFNRAGHNDIVIAARGGNFLYVLSGDGKGNLTPWSTVSLPGTVSVMATRSLGVARKTSEVVVGVNTADGPALFVFGADDAGLVQLARIPLSAPATELAFGDLVGDPTADIVVVTDGTIQIVFGRGIEALANGKLGKIKIETVSVVSGVKSLAIGRFVPDRSPRMQMAVLSGDGTVSIIGHGAYDARPYTTDEWKALAAFPRGKAKLPVSVAPGQSTGWQVLETFPALALASNGDPLPIVLRARISSQEMDDVMVLNPSAHQLFVIAHMNRTAGETTMPMGVVSSMPLYATPLAAIVARVNIDARPGVVLLNQDRTAPSVMMPLPDPTFTVNTTADTVDAAPGNGVCADAGGQCSLRAAIMEANATAGADTIIVPAGTYTLTIPGIDEELAATGDLDITDSVNIVGAGAGTTIIQAGATSSTGIEKVFSVNPLSLTTGTAGPSINVSMSGLTIRYGRNTSTASPYGGAMDFDAGTGGTGTLTITNCVIAENSVPITNPSVTTLSDGGGLFTSNELSTAPTVTITGTTVQNNLVGDIGGGIASGNNVSLTVTNSQILNNTATGAGTQQGGGIYFFGGTGTLAVHNSTVSGNNATNDGGGIYAAGAATVDQGSIVKNNVSGRDGGGLFLNPPGNTVSIAASTITGNTASGNGGGVEVSSNAGTVNINFNRIVSNTAGGSGGALHRVASTVTATNNWWGTNSPTAPLISGTVTYDPYIVLTHTASPNPIRINQSTMLTADMSKDNHGSGTALAGNLSQIAGLLVTFGNASMGTIPLPDTANLNGSAQATVTFTAGGTGGRGTANATVDSVVAPVNISQIATATESGTIVTITTVAPHGFLVGQSVVIAGVGIGGYNGTFVITSVTSTTFTYTTTALGLGVSSGGTATVGIIILEPPSISIAFGASTIAPNTATTLTFTVTNPNILPINASFTDSLPTNLVTSIPTGAVNNCGGTFTNSLPLPATSVSFSNSALPVGTCTITVNVQSAVDNNYSNSVTINSTDAGTGNTASANLTVIAPPTITKSFGAATIPLNGTTTLSFALNNPNTNLNTQGMSFTDSLPAGLVVASAPAFSNTCGGTGTAIAVAGSVGVTGFIMAPGSSCSVSVNVQGTTVGAKNNSVYVTSSNAPDSAMSNASVTVVGPPTITKSFGATAIPQNGTTSLSFTLQNDNTTTTLHGIGFTDSMPAGIAITSGVTGSCGGGVINAPGSSLTLSGATLAPGASCTFSVTVTGIYAGQQTNTTGNVTSTEGGTGATATASIKVEAPPGFSDLFTPTTISLNGTTSMQFTLTNPAANLDPLTGVGFSITLPTGLTVANASTSQCGGTLTTTAPTGIALSGATLAVNSQCQFNVTVTGATSGYYEFIGGPATSTNGGSGNQAIAYLTVVSPPSITKAFGATQISLNGTTPLTFTIQNPNTSATLTGVAFTDSLPAGMVVASTPNLSNTCGGIATAVGGSGSVSLLSGSLTASASCTVSVTVQGTTAGSKNNSVQVTSTQGGTGNTSNASVGVVGPPTITKSFGAPSIPLNGSTTLTFNISNPNAAYALNGLSFTDTMPAGLVVATPNALTGSCGAGTITATSGTNEVSLSNGAIIPGGSCWFSINVTGTSAGTKNNTAGAVTSTEGGTGATSNTASISVVAPPTISKAFGAANVTLNGTTTLTFTITNPASNTVAESGVAFSDTLTNGLQVASTPGVSNTCGGTVTAVANSTSISLTGGSIATPGTTCTIVVNVTGTASGIVTNTTGAVSSTNGSTGATSNTAALTVASPPAIAIAFGTTRIPLNGTTTLTFTIQNSNTAVALNGVAFTDNLPAGLVVASTPNLNSTCGGTATAVAGSSTVSLSGGTLAANTSCTVTVNVTGTTAGAKATSAQVTSTEGGTGNTDLTTITVVGPPGFIKAFGASSIPLNGSTSLSFTIQNNNDSTILTGVAFSDTLPAGLVISTPNGLTGSCGSGTITATAGSNTVALTGGRIAPTASCTFSVNVTGTVAGTQNNITGNVTSTEGGTGGTASASISVLAPPSISISFVPANVALGGGSSLDVTITNPAANTGALTGVAFTATLPSGVVLNGSSTISYCGGTLTLTTPSSISFSGATIAANSFCNYGIGTTSSTSGVHTVTTSAVTSTNGGTGNTGSATLTVASPPVIATAFGAAAIPLNGATSLTFTIQNPATNTIALTGLGFTDTLPAGLVVASPSGLASNCGGTATANAGSSSVVLAGGTLAVNSTCQVSVNVTGTTAGVKNNSVQVTSTEGGNGNTSTISLTVVAPPVIAKAFGAVSIQLNASTTLTFNITNPNAAVALSGVAFTDVFPAGLVISTPNGLLGSCGTGTITATAGTGTVTLSGGTLAAGGSCSFVVNVTGTAGGVQNNTTGNITSTEGGTGATASASVTVQAPDMTVVSSHAGNFRQGQTGASYTITVTNSGAAPTSGTVTLVDTLPTGLTATAISGTGWMCVLGTLTCTRTDALAIGVSYPAIALTVNVANNAAANITNTAAVSGGSETNTANNTASDPTTIDQVADLTVTKSHAGAFIQGLTGTYTLTVNNVGPGPTVGTVTLTDTLPTGMTATAMSGTGWTCTLGTLTCTRSDALSNASSYPAVTLSVNVAGNAPTSLTNSAVVGGGGELNTANNSGTDPTTIQAALVLTGTVASATVKAGDPGQFTLGLTAASGVSGTVTFSCGTLPTGAACAFQPASLTASTTQQNIGLTITTSPKYLAMNQQKQAGSSTVFYAMLSFPLVGVVFVGFAGKRNRIRCMAILLLAIGIGALAGCGGRKTNPSATPAGSYPISVTATNGTSQAQTVVTLTVQ